MSEYEGAPKVFISHASEDKERFVLEFAKKLREKGVDAWLDKWEMMPGDSLVDKIFEEGIKNSNTFIVVLSKNSVQKPWVKEELNAAFVKKINHGDKLIPVILDDCQVPEALNSTLWESIKNLDDYSKNLDRIIGSIFGFTEKPALGPLPSYAGNSVVQVGTLNKIDSLVMTVSCEATLKQGACALNPVKLFNLDTATPLVPAQELQDSLEVLNDRGSIRLYRTLGGGLFNYSITEAGFEIYARSCMPDYNDVTKMVMQVIVNENITDNASIATRLEKPKYLIEHILTNLEHHGYIKTIKALGGHQIITDVKVSLRRAMQDIL
ncbi:TIR domain-containing protein [Serratia fonticola]|uniref:TIR domain-containing protein n=1 Tax=Serratia fonticola TaxID=47917 RepID=UPI001644B557|nr:TIR domain-containing protein [Serratia fonticola]MBC3216147.1 TIR domain-containing protein [Serratia fonticola]